VKIYLIFASIKKKSRFLTSRKLKREMEGGCVWIDGFRWVGMDKNNIKFLELRKIIIICN